MTRTRAVSLRSPVDLRDLPCLGLLLAMAMAALGAPAARADTPHPPQSPAPASEQASATPAWTPANLAPRSESRADLLEGVQPVADARRDTVVEVQTGGVGSALGVVVGSEGIILTKASELGLSVRVALSDGRVLDARVVAVDPATDLALLRAPITGLRPVEWAPGDAPVGRWVVTPGPRGRAASVGIVSSPPRRIASDRLVLGLELEPRPAPAVRAAPADDDPSAQTAPPLRIRAVTLGAAEAGLLPGDRLLSVAGRSAVSLRSVAEALADRVEGERVEVAFLRDGARQTTRVTLRADRRFDPGPLERPAPGRLLVSARRTGFPAVLQHDSVLEPWLCGGPLLDLDGRAVGVNIARAGRASTYALPAALVRQRLQLLIAASAQPPTQRVLAPDPPG
ncbi:MAG: S1C family serine protease [Planctomycetota bacterium]